MDPKNVRDIQRFKKYRFFLWGLKIFRFNYQATKLSKLAKIFLDIDIQNGQHSSVEDARVALSLYRIYENQINKFSINTPINLDFSKNSEVQKKGSFSNSNSYYNSTSPHFGTYGNSPKKFNFNNQHQQNGRTLDFSNGVPDPTLPEPAPVFEDPNYQGNEAQQWGQTNATNFSQNNSSGHMHINNTNHNHYHHHRGKQTNNYNTFHRGNQSMQHYNNSYNRHNNYVVYNNYYGYPPYYENGYYEDPNWMMGYQAPPPQKRFYNNYHYDKRGGSQVPKTNAKTNQEDASNKDGSPTPKEP